MTEGGKIVERQRYTGASQQIDRSH